MLRGETTFFCFGKEIFPKQDVDELFVRPRVWIHLTYLEETGKIEIKGL